MTTQLFSISHNVKKDKRGTYCIRFNDKIQMLLVIYEFAVVAELLHVACSWTCETDGRQGSVVITSLHYKTLNGV